MDDFLCKFLNYCNPTDKLLVIFGSIQIALRRVLRTGNPYIGGLPCTEATLERYTQRVSVKETK